MIVSLLALTLTASAQDVARGEVLAAFGGCASCHVSPEGEAYAGGYAIETRFGTFYGPNITPDISHGIGTWSQADFVRAMRDGHGPSGKPYWPAFPYLWFTHAPDQDLWDLWAYLKTVTPSARVNDEHQIKPLYKTDLWLWRLIAFRPGPLKLAVDTPADVALGAQLVEGIGHCAGCHTPLNGFGKPIPKRAFGGNRQPPERAPNITPDPDAGIGAWTQGDLLTFFETGMTGEGDYVGGHMARIVENGSAKLTDVERQAIVAYLRSLAPVGPEKGATPEESPEE